MPLFEVSADGLIPFRQLESGAGGYDEAIEDVLWRNLDGLIGERLFRVRRQAPLDGGGRPAVVALDPEGSVVVFHVRRQIDRTGLAECLEYAGWARAATLDELAQLYWRGESDFWVDWHAFLGDVGTRQVKPSPRLYLATGDFTARAQSTFEFLVDNGLPVKVMKATLYEGSNGRRVLDVEAPSDVETVLRPSKAAEATFERLSRSARRSAERALDRAPEPARAGDPGRPVPADHGRSSVPEPSRQHLAEPGRQHLADPGEPGRPNPGEPGRPNLGEPGRSNVGEPGRPNLAEPAKATGQATPVIRPQQMEPGPNVGRPIEPVIGRSHEPTLDPTQNWPGPRELERAPERPGQQHDRAPERPVDRTQERPPVIPLDRSRETPGRRSPDLLQDPLSGGLLPPPNPLTAEQLRNDPLGVDQIIAGQLANADQEQPEPPADPRGSLGRTGPQGIVPSDRRPVTGPPAPPTGELPGESPYHRGGQPNSARGSQPIPPFSPQHQQQAPTPPGMLPPPPSAHGRQQPPQHDQERSPYEPPAPEQPDPRSEPPRRGQFPNGPGLSVVPPNPDQPNDPDAQLPEPPVAEVPEHTDERPERTRLSDIMDPRMLRVPDGFAWDPRSTNGNRDNGHS